MIVGVFNNKGGVGKTTYMYHIAHAIAAADRTVLMVDCDPQCNLTAYCMSDSAIERSWQAERGNSIYRAIELLHEGLGDIRDRKPTRFSDQYTNLWIVPGDPALSDFEDTLGDAWNRAKGGAPAAVRKQSGISRYVRAAAEKIEADIVFIDLGPNLGPLNRAALSSCDYFLTPVSPDLFSIRGTENLGRKLKVWNSGWAQIRESVDDSSELPEGQPKFLGYVTQQHNLRNNSAGMTAGWKIFGTRVEQSVIKNIVDQLKPLGQVVEWDDESYNLGKIPNLHSLVPYSQEARKPIFDCTSQDGLRGAHVTSAKNTRELFEGMAHTLIGMLE